MTPATGRFASTNPYARGGAGVGAGPGSPAGSSTNLLASEKPNPAMMQAPLSPLGTGGLKTPRSGDPFMSSRVCFIFYFQFWLREDKAKRGLGVGFFGDVFRQGEFWFFYASKTRIKHAVSFRSRLIPVNGAPTCLCKTASQTMSCITRTRDETTASTTVEAFALVAVFSTWGA